MYSCRARPSVLISCIGPGTLTALSQHLCANRVVASYFSHCKSAVNLYILDYLCYFPCLHGKRVLRVQWTQKQEQHTKCAFFPFSFLFHLWKYFEWDSLLQSISLYKVATYSKVKYPGENLLWSESSTIQGNCVIGLWHQGEPEHLASILHLP